MIVFDIFICVVRHIHIGFHPTNVKKMKKIMISDSETIQVIVMYYNKILSAIPVIIYPDENLKKKEEILHPIKYHPIWFLDLDDQDLFEHIAIIYKGKVYCAKKFKILSKRNAIRPETNDDTLDIAVIIIVLPKILDIFRLKFLNIVSEIILRDNIDSFYKIIESEILKENLIRTPIVKNIINVGDSLKIEIKEILKNIWKNYFQKVINQYHNHYLLKY